jgi:hypothetical protein
MHIQAAPQLYAYFSGWVMQRIFVWQREEPGPRSRRPIWVSSGRPAMSASLLLSSQ